MDLKQLITVVSQISKERNLEPERILEAIQDALATAYRREYGKRGEIVKAQLNPKTGELKFWQVKEVVDGSIVRIVEEGVEGEGTGEVALPQGEETEEAKLPRYNAERHIMLEEARAIRPGAALGGEVEFPLETRTDFGRIAAQAAKQVILQKFREAEKESVMAEFKDKAGTIVSGSVHRFDRGNVYVDLGRVSGILFPNEAIPGEHYRQGDRLRFYVLAVQEDNRGQPEIVLSRSHPKFVEKLFELEVPEIADGIVEIKAILREPGSRTKMAVYSEASGVDPVGSCVGQRGTRVMAVTNELGREKIDVIEWSEDPEKFIAFALSPAKVKGVEIVGPRRARVVVAEDQLSLAIGKSGQNARLAAKLTGYGIDVRSEVRPDEEQDGGVAIGEEGEEVEETAAQSADGAEEGLGEGGEPAEEVVPIPKPLGEDE